MTDNYLQFGCTHYGLYGNAPVRADSEAGRFGDPRSLRGGDAIPREEPGEHRRLFFFAENGRWAWLTGLAEPPAPLLLSLAPSSTCRSRCSSVRYSLASEQLSSCRNAHSASFGLLWRKRSSKLTPFAATQRAVSWMSFSTLRRSTTSSGCPGAICCRLLRSVSI